MAPSLFFPLGGINNATRFTGGALLTRPVYLSLTGNQKTNNLGYVINLFKIKN